MSLLFKPSEVVERLARHHSDGRGNHQPHTAARMALCTLSGLLLYSNSSSEAGVRHLNLILQLCVKEAAACVKDERDVVLPS